jgi:hypothetical protein
MPVSVGIKNKVKTFIDVFVDTTATGIGGIILIFLINGLNLSIQAVCAHYFYFNNMLDLSGHACKG